MTQRRAAPWRLRRALGGVVLGCVALATHAEPVPLGDDALGMTCHYYAAAGLLRWQRPGGDWRDAAGTLHGNEPFTTASLPAQNTVPAVIGADLTALARTWERGDGVPGGVMVRLLGGRGWGTFGSREHAEPPLRPRLLLSWDDGHREQLHPAADSYSGCPTHRSLGNGPALQIGDGHAVLLVFPYKPRAGRQLTQARLELTALRASMPAKLGMFALQAAAAATQPVQQGLAARFVADTGIERDPDVLFAERFERSDWASSWVRGAAHAQGQALAADPGNGFEPLDRKALKASIEAGQQLGLDLRLPFKRLAGGEPEEAFVRYYLRLGQDWDPRIDGGKLPGLAGTYDRGGWGGRRADGVNGWSARGAFLRRAADGSALAALRGIGSYLYHVDTESSFGEQVGWNLGPTGMLLKNRWYCIEQQVRLNHPEARDGVFRAWVDGQLVYERTDLRFRTTPALRIQNLWMDLFHGGTEKSPQRMSLYVDNVVVARRYIGPMGGR